MLRAALLALAIAGCLGLGPDESAPHTLRLANEAPDATRGNVTVALEGETILRHAYSLASGAREETPFGPADHGRYAVTVDDERVGVRTEEWQMGRGGWRLEIRLGSDRIAMTTLHAD